jgi:hypothetical protein
MILIRVLSVAALLSIPSLAAAQSAAQAPAQPAAYAEQTGPRLEAARVGIAPAVAAAEERSASAVSAAAAPRWGESVALMAVGGAALVAGLIIGGDAGTVVALGGAVIGLIGLYQYLK